MSEAVRDSGEGYGESVFEARARVWARWGSVVEEMSSVNWDCGMGSRRWGVRLWGSVMMGTKSGETGQRGIQRGFPRGGSPSSMFLDGNWTTMAGNHRMDGYYGYEWDLERCTAGVTVGWGRTSSLRF